MNIKPSAKKLAHCDTSKELKAGDVAVVQYRVVRLDPVSKELEVSMEPLCSAAAWSRVLSPALLQTCYTWQIKKGSLTAVLPDSSMQEVPDMQHCVCKFYLDRAVPGTTNYVAMSQVADSVRGAVDVLVEKGYIRQSEGLCQLTSDGVRALQLTQVLVQPAALLSLEQGKMVDKRSGVCFISWCRKVSAYSLCLAKTIFPRTDRSQTATAPPTKSLQSVQVAKP